MDKLFKKQKAFTLIELLVVIMIIVILATLLYINYNYAKAKSRDDKRKSDIQSYAGAVGIYYADNKAYPASTSANTAYALRTDLTSPSPRPSYLNIFNYMSGIPADPLNTSANPCYYLYLSDTTGSQFKLMSTNAETLGSSATSCKDKAGEYADPVNNACKVFQVSSNNTAAQMTFTSVTPGSSINGCPL